MTAQRIARVLCDSRPEPPPGLFSNCLVAGGFIHVSGQHAGAPNGAIGGDDMFAQSREALARVLAFVEAAGARASDVVKLTVYVTEIARRAEVGRARRAVFADPMPCATLVEVRALAAPDLLVEIDALALAPS